jgi:hypothetical protein
VKVAIRPDTDLETRIDVAYSRLLGAVSEIDRRQCWVEFTRLLALRSPMRIKQMERQKGLDKRATFAPREGRGMSN